MSLLRASDIKKLEHLRERATEAQDIANEIRQELEMMPGRKRDIARFTKIVDLLDEWQRD